MNMLKTKLRYTLVLVFICLLMAGITALFFHNRSDSKKTSQQPLKASAAATSIEDEAFAVTTESSTLFVKTGNTVQTTTLSTTSTSLTSTNQLTTTSVTTSQSTVSTKLIPAVSTAMLTTIGEAVSETKASCTTTESATSDVISEVNSQQAVATVRIPAEFAARHFVDLSEESNWVDICFSEEDAYFLAAVNGFDLETAPPVGRYKVPTGVALTIPSSWQDENGIRILPPGIEIQVYQTPEEVDPEKNPLNSYLIPAEIPDE